MTDITLRLVKGTPLTNAEVDNNFSNLNSAKYEAGASPDFVDTLTDKLSLDTTAAVAPGVGEVSWDDGNGTAQLGLKGGNTTLQIGQETLARVYNDSGVALTDGQVVYISGAQGNRVAVKLAKADSETTSFGTLGVVTEPIAIGAEGFIAVLGTVNGLNTLGFTSGALLYLSATTAGAFTATAPVAPNHRVTIGYVERVHGTAGSIYVKVDNGYEIGELHDVVITTPSAGEVLLYNATSSIWENKAPSNISGLNASNLTSGTVPTARLGSGTPNTTTFLRGDQTWSVVTAPNNGTLTMAVSGTGLSGSATFTADQSGNSTFTVTSNATSANTASTVVARDASGNFSAGTITASLSGNATNVTGTVAIANGGTGATTRQNAMDALAGATTAGYYLRGNGTDVVMSAIQAADVPTLNQNTTGTASNVTGTVAIANGGTGATTAAAALTNLGAQAAATAITTSNIGSQSVNYATTAGNGGVTSVNGQTGAVTVTSGITISNDTTTNATRYLVFEDVTSGTSSAMNVASTKFTVNPSTGYMYAASFSATSDERLKDNWRPVRFDFIGRLAELKSGIYNRIDTGVTQAGVSAQSLQKVLPETVEADADGILSVAYGNAALVAAVELAKEVVALRAELNALKEKVNGN